MPTNDVAVVLGTRPEIIKLAPVITELGDRAQVIHTGQHYDDELAGQYFRAFDLPKPDVVLTGIGGRSRGEQIGAAITALTRQFTEHRPKLVLVQGDTNTVCAAAQAAQYAGIPVGHVEAGLRSYDRGMPEEINRIVTGTLADLHFAPTETSAANLRREGVPTERILVTGNTVVEATLMMRQQPHRPASSWFPNEVAPPQYVLATIHRPENTDTRDALQRVLEALVALPAPVVFLAHPRTRAAIHRFQLENLLEPLIVHESPASADFLELAANAAVVVSDSGGVQEECTVLKVPLAVIRRSTERPEAIDAGFAWLITPSMSITAEVTTMLRTPSLRGMLRASSSRFGDGHASKRIAAAAPTIADNSSLSDRTPPTSIAA